MSYKQTKIEDYFPTEPQEKQNIKPYNPPKLKQTKIAKIDWKLGICQLCGFECNPASQQCSYCTRSQNCMSNSWIYRRKLRELQDIIGK
jgi:hypothetical protein